MSDAPSIGVVLERLQALVEANQLEQARREAEVALTEFDDPDQQIALLAIVSQIHQGQGNSLAARAAAERAAQVAEAAGRHEPAKALRRLAASARAVDADELRRFQPLADQMTRALDAGDARGALAVAETLLPTADALGGAPLIAVAIGGATAALALATRSAAATFLDRADTDEASKHDWRTLARLRGVLEGPDAQLAEFAGNFALKHGRLDDAVAVLEPALPFAEAAEALTLRRMLAVTHFRARRVADALEHSAAGYRLARDLGDARAANALAEQVMQLRERLADHVPSRPRTPPAASSTAAGMEKVLAVLAAGDLMGARAMTQATLAQLEDLDPRRVPLLSLRARLDRMAGDLEGAQASLQQAAALAEALGGGPLLEVLAAQSAELAMGTGASPASVPSTETSTSASTSTSDGSA